MACAKQTKRTPAHICAEPKDHLESAGVVTACQALHTTLHCEISRLSAQGELHSVWAGFVGDCHEHRQTPIEQDAARAEKTVAVDGLNARVDMHLHSAGHAVVQPHTCFRAALASTHAGYSETLRASSGDNVRRG